MQNKIIERINQDLGTKDLISILSEALNPSDFQSLMLKIAEQRSAKISPPQLLKQYKSNRFVAPCSAPVRDLIDLEYFILEQIHPDFEVIDLSPIAPFGSCSALATVHQNKIVSTFRNTEVMSDSSNVLALECAKRRELLLKKDSKNNEIIHLASNNRVVRAQFIDIPNFTPHFKLLTLVSAGRDIGNSKFELESLRIHLSSILKILTTSNENFEFQSPILEIRVWNINLKKRLELELIPNLKERFYKVKTIVLEEKMKENYYHDLMFSISISPVNSTESFTLVDGGFTNWTGQLLSNKKERLLITGFGSELVTKLFNKK